MMSKSVEAGDLCEIVTYLENGRTGDICMVLYPPETVNVGAWGLQHEVWILHQGGSKRVPVYYLRKLDKS